MQTTKTPSLDGFDQNDEEWLNPAVESAEVDIAARNRLLNVTNSVRTDEVVSEALRTEDGRTHTLDVSHGGSVHSGEHNKDHPVASANVLKHQSSLHPSRVMAPTPMLSPRSSRFRRKGMIKVPLTPEPTEHPIISGSLNGSVFSGVSNLAGRAAYAALDYVFFLPRLNPINSIAGPVVAPAIAPLMQHLRQRRVAKKNGKKEEGNFIDWVDNLLLPGVIDGHVDSDLTTHLDDTVHQAGGNNLLDVNEEIAFLENLRSLDGEGKLLSQNIPFMKKPEQYARYCYREFHALLTTLHDRASKGGRMSELEQGILRDYWINNPSDADAQDKRKSLMHIAAEHALAVMYDHAKRNNNAMTTTVVSSIAISALIAAMVTGSVAAPAIALVASAPVVVFEIIRRLVHRRKHKTPDIIFAKDGTAIVSREAKRRKGKGVLFNDSYYAAAKQPKEDSAIHYYADKMGGPPPNILNGSIKSGGDIGAEWQEAMIDGLNNEPGFVFLDEKMQADLKDKKKEAETKVQELKQDLTQKQVQEKTLKGEKARLEQKKKMMESRESSVQADRTKIGTLENEVAIRKSSLKKVLSEQKKDTLTRNLLQKVKNVDLLQDDQIRLSGELSDLRDSSTTLTSEVARLSNEVSLKDQEVAQCNADIAALAVEIEKLTAQLVHSTDEAKTLELDNKIQAKEAEKQLQRDMLPLLEAERATLQKSLASAQSQQSDTLNTIQSTEQELQRVTDEIHRLDGEIIAEQKIIDTSISEDEGEDVRTEIGKLNKQIATLERDIERSEHEVQAYKAAQEMTDTNRIGEIDGDLSVLAINIKALLDDSMIPPIGKLPDAEAALQSAKDKLSTFEDGCKPWKIDAEKILNPKTDKDRADAEAIMKAFAWRCKEAWEKIKKEHADNPLKGTAQHVGVVAAKLAGITTGIFAGSAIGTALLSQSINWAFGTSLSASGAAGLGLSLPVIGLIFFAISQGKQLPAKFGELILKLGAKSFENKGSSSTGSSASSSSSDSKPEGKK